MTTLAVVIARTGSTRLPGKVLMNLSGKPVLSWVVDAAKAAPFVDNVIVATSTLPGDDRIAAWCDRNEVRVFRGSESDVLSRVAGAARTVDGTTVVIRITADCPFIDPAVISAVVRLQKATGCAYASNIEPRTWPDGLDVEASTVDALFAAEQEAIRPIDRECVTTWIQRNRSRFPAETVICPIPGLATERWVLDTADDYEFCKAIAAKGMRRPASYLDILAILDREPAIRDINRAGVMNERYFAALADEPIYSRSFTRSQEAFRRAEKVIPLAAQTFSKSHLQFPQPSPLFLSHGQGGITWDVDGNEYIDLVSALLPSILGYRDPDVDAAVRRQLTAGVSFSLATELEAQLAETLCRLIPCAEMVRFGKNGSDATTAAVRLARAHTGRDRVLICDQYHGWGDTFVAGTDRGHGIPKAIASLSMRIPFGDIERLQDAFATEQFAAVICEPTEDPAFLRAARQITERLGTVLIFDEIICGFRWALGGGQEHFGVTPDLATFGKAMANGLPLSAIVGRRDIMKLMAPPGNIFFSGTYMGETLSLAGALATVDKLERKNVPTVLRERAETLRRTILSIRDSLGIAFAFDVDESPLARLKFLRPEWQKTFVREMIASGTLIIASNNLCLAHSASDMRRVLKSYNHALSVLADRIDWGRPA